MLVSGIKSKPVYEPLRPDLGGRSHVMLARGVGAAALLRVLDEMRVSAPESLSAVDVLFLPEAAGAGGPTAAGDFGRLNVRSVVFFDAVAALLARFRAVLEGSLMGTRLYVAGPESFIGLVMQIALEFNMNKDEVRAEELGSLARRVYCVHCRTTSEDIQTNIVRCAGCERWLLVRDHYSRRLAAYMGVMVDAEAPGELPQVRQVFL